MKFETLIYLVLLIMLSFSPEHSFENVTQKIETRRADDQLNKISLEKYDQSEFKAQAFTQRSSLSAKANVTFTITDIPNVVSFMIVQIHAFKKNVSIYYNRNLEKPLEDIIFGRNIGLFVDTSAKFSIDIYVENYNTEIVEVLFAVVAYTSEAPVPGGCNMEFKPEISPFHKLMVTEAIVIVDAQPSSSSKNMKTICEKSVVQHEAYRLYLPAQDFSSESYFSAIENMLTPEKIVKHAEKIPASSTGSSLRRVYSAYSGIGSAYAMVATYKNQSAAYVPAFSYACTTSFEIDGCTMLPNGIAKTTCLLMIFLGIYLSFMGHRNSNTTIFLFSCLGGGLIGYICAVHAGTHSASSTLWIAIGSGIAVACVWQIFINWLSKEASKFFAISFFAFFCSCITYYKLPDKTLPFENDYYFWGFFCSLSFLMLTVIYITCMSSIFYCSVFGAYLLIVAFDYYIGSSLKYIIINIVRRITVTNFDVAIIAPPYGTAEMTLTAFWVIFALMSFVIQLKSSCERRNRSNEMTIPFATIDDHGAVHYTPWADIFRTHRQLRRSLRDPDRANSRSCNIL